MNQPSSNDEEGYDVDPSQLSPQYTQADIVNAHLGVKQEIHAGWRTTISTMWFLGLITLLVVVFVPKCGQ